MSTSEAIPSVGFWFLGRKVFRFLFSVEQPHRWFYSEKYQHDKGAQCAPYTATRQAGRPPHELFMIYG
jgi:hypothetical protein